MIEKKEKKFVCDYCGKEYDTPLARAKCELECDRKRVAEEERQLKEKLAKEKEDRKNEIFEARKRVYFLEGKYRKDYGEGLPSIREPITRTVTFDGDWGKYFEDVFGRIRW